MKRKPMGAAATNVLRGADALALATGATAPAPAGKRARPSTDTTIVTTVRLTRAQWGALRTAAMKEAMKSGTKPDASKLLREILDGWMKRQ